MLLIFPFAPCIIESMDANDDSFFDHVSGVLDKRIPRQTLTIDENFTVHIPVRVLVRYDLRKGFELFCDPNYGCVVWAFVKKPNADVPGEAMPQEATQPLDCREFFVRHKDELDLPARLPARFAFTIEPPESLDTYHGRGNEVVVTFMEWRRYD